MLLAQMPFAINELDTLYPSLFYFWRTMPSLFHLLKRLLGWSPIPGAAKASSASSGRTVSIIQSVPTKLWHHNQVFLSLHLVPRSQSHEHILVAINCFDFVIGEF